MQPVTIKLAPKPERKRVETDIVHDIMRALSRIRGVRVARNNVGVLEDIRGIPVTYGLGDGSPDLVGIITLGGINTFLPELAELEPWPLTIAIEVKQPKRYPSPKQRTWHAAAKRRGLRVGVARSKEDATDHVEAIRGNIRAWLRRAGGLLA